MEQTLDVALTVREIVEDGALEALAAPWRALWRRCADATPFQHPEWLLPWRRAFRRGAVWTLAAWSGDRLVGLLPQYVYPHPEQRRRVVLLLGTGNTDYLDLLVEPGYERAVGEAFREALAEGSARWDVCDWQQLRSGSPLLELPAPAGRSSRVSEQVVCPVLTIPPAASCDDVVPESLLRKLHYFRRRAGREGRVDLERADPETFDALYEALIRLHGVRWRDQDEPGVLADGVVQRFHREVAEGMLHSGLLRLYGLRLDGHLVACYYGFLHGSSAYYYLSGFDPAYGRLSPGNQIVHVAIEEAIAEGATTFDFLRGPEPYKYRWGARDRTNFRRTLSPGRTARPGSAV